MFGKLLALRMLLVSLVLTALAACGSRSGQPQQIAAFPQGLDTPPGSPAGIIYDAWLRLAVWDVERSAAEAVQMAEAHGGYLVRSYTWTLENRQQTAVTLAVPPYRFEHLRGDLKSLGSLLEETVSADPVWAGDHGRESQVHVQFQARGLRLGPVLAPGWDPLHTFQQALGVFLSIFGTLMDVLIWVGVVAGPFALLAWGVVALLRRRGGHPPARHDARPEDPSEELS